MLAILTSHPIQYQAPLWRTMARQESLDFEVWFLTPHAVEPSRDREFDQVFAWDEDLLSGFPHYFLPIAPGWRMDEFRGVSVTKPWEQLFAERGISALWVEGWRFSTFWSAIKSAHKLGLPVLMRGENNDLRPVSLKHRLLYRPLLRRLFGRVSHFLTIGTANRRFYVGLGIAGSQIHPAPYAVDNDRWRERTTQLRPKREKIREALGIHVDHQCLLFCGKLIPKKRPLDLLRAARSRSDHEDTPVHLLYAGDGELRAQLEKELQHPDSPKSTLTGFVNLSRIGEIFAASDALVLPSDYGETWGLVVNEAMACGLPAIVSDQCGCAEDLVAPVARELVFRTGDVNDLHRALHYWQLHPPSPKQIISQIDRHHLRHTVETVGKLFKN